MQLSGFFKSGGLVRLSRNFYVSVFSVAAAAVAFLTDFSTYTLLVVLSILVHEMSHVVFLKMYKARMLRTVVYPFGVDMVWDTSRLSIAKEFLCVISGSAVNIALCVAFWQLFCLYGAKWMLFFCVSNGCYGFANLVPLSTFDGGRALYLLLCVFFLPDKVYTIQRCTDVFCLGALCALGFCFADFCGFNLSLIASFVYCLAAGVLFGLHKKRYI